MNEIIKATIDTEIQRDASMSASLGCVPALREEIEFSILHHVPEHLHAATFERLMLAVLTGEIVHLYQSECPETLQPLNRDSGCVACRVIMEYERINQLSRGNE
jgi:hypothetical protein